MKIQKTKPREEVLWQGVLLDFQSMMYNLMYFAKHNTPSENEQKIIHDKPLAVPGPKQPPQVIHEKPFPVSKPPKDTFEYFRLGFAFVALGCILALVLVCAYTLHCDVQRKLQLSAKEASIEIEQCAQNYLENKCDPQERVPFANDYCREMEKCMSRDPYEVTLSSSLGAMLLAEVLNSFVEPLTFKTLSFLLVTCMGCVLLVTSCVNRPKLN